MKATFALLVSLALYACVPTSFGQTPSGERLEKIKAAKNAKGGHFVNALPRHEPTFEEVVTAFKGRAQKHRPAKPVSIWRQSDIKKRDEGLALTWLGHSTLLIDIDGKRVLTDPIFSERASPFEFVGPARFHKTPIALDHVRDVDVVVISHDHYDHLDEKSIKALAARNIDFVVPLGVGAHLEYWGVSAERIHERNWWEEVSFGNLTLACLPARHFSGRGLGERDQTLWSGWAIIGDEHRVFFSGDTALSPDFADIGDRYGPFDIAAVESGAFNGMWADVHMGPEQAVFVSRLVNARALLPVHWGTFSLGLHTYSEPIERIMLAAQKSKVSVLLPMPGQTVDEDFEGSRWWPKGEFDLVEESPAWSSGIDRAALEKRIAARAQKSAPSSKDKPSKK